MNHAVAATHHWQRLAHHALTPYHWGAHHTTTTTAARWRIATRWWDHARVAHAGYVHWLATRPRWYVPAWFAAKMPCLAMRESSTQNSWAGYFGMISSPASYPGGAEVVAVYGNSWYSIPWDAQVYVVYHEWLTVGGLAGWPNTSTPCGLA